MNRIETVAATVLVGVRALAARAADEKSKADKPPTSAEQFQALKDEYDKYFKDLIQLQQRIATIPKRMMELAEKQPADPGSLDALLFVVQDPFVSQDPQFQTL